MVIVSHPGFCPRHVLMAVSTPDRLATTREDFAETIIAGTFAERDLTEDEARWAAWAAEDRIGHA